MLMPILRAIAIVVLLAAFSVAATALQLVGTRHGARLADRFAVLFCRSMLHMLGVRLRIEGAPATTPALIVANHVSWIDILALGSRPSTCFLAKAEVQSWPVIARFARLKGTVFVERRRRRSIIPANADIAVRLREGRSVVVFPEGTTSDGTAVGRFGSSHVESVLTAYRAGTRAVLQPIALAYDHPRAAWIGDESLVPHLLSILRLGTIECTLAFSPPMTLDSTTMRKPLTLMARDVVAAELLRLQCARHAMQPDANEQQITEVAIQYS